MVSSKSLKNEFGTVAAFGRQREACKAKEDINLSDLRASSCGSPFPSLVGASFSHGTRAAKGIDFVKDR